MELIRNWLNTVYYSNSLNNGKSTSNNNTQSNDHSIKVLSSNEAEENHKVTNSFFDRISKMFPSITSFFSTTKNKYPSEKSGDFSTRIASLQKFLQVEEPKSDSSKKSSDLAVRARLEILELRRQKQKSEEFLSNEYIPEKAKEALRKKISTFQKTSWHNASLVDAAVNEALESCTQEDWANLIKQLESNLTSKNVSFTTDQKKNAYFQNIINYLNNPKVDYATKEAFIARIESGGIPPTEKQLKLSDEQWQEYLTKDLQQTPSKTNEV